ncbi:MAG: hydantoinase/oxoprolinase family protein [Candidatus Lambdaproteobacteria bacterium]|nr:hydantoinase/oxoprolinase family protein [Candidatus Lambdaproteobacteria bacterium]
MADYALGIDIGGTFTDIVLYDGRSRRHRSGKVLTTPDDPARGVVDGLIALLRESELAPEGISRVVHATTLFANALIERTGATTGLITTQGFRDVLEIGRERKYELYDLAIEMPQPLVPRHLRLEVAERLGPGGEVLTSLDAEALDRCADRLVRAGAESVAVVFLHAYANPDHERQALARLEQRHPGVFRTASHEVAPEIREYERSSTTVANAYVKPMAHRYLDHLARQIGELHVGAPLLLMLSSGGLTHVAEARRNPIHLLESGPAAGALAAAWFGGQGGERNLIAFDMGGTTAKLSLVDGGEPRIAYAFEAARQKRFIEGSGLPIQISTIELIEIGAGGGSIAHVDGLGLLKVGPRSAGSEPGPACYQRGGLDPTVTDADLVLGYLNPDYFVGGAMPISRAAAERALAKLAAATGLAPAAVAWGIHDVVNENMASAARVHVAERGKDPRNYALLPTGGAGPVHAYYVAKKLGLSRVVCPPSAGVASALGLLMAPARVDRVATVAGALAGLDWAEFEAQYRRLEAEARAVIHETGLPAESVRVQRLADLRYQGQAFELVVGLPPGPYGPESLGPIARAFEAEYLRTFARLPPGVPIECVNVRVSVRAAIPGSGLALTAAGAGPGARGSPLKGSRPAYFPESGGYTATAVYDRYRLRPGETYAGPAVVEERESTVVLGPGSRFALDDAGNLIVAMPDAAKEQP